YFLVEGKETNNAYNPSKEEIQILFKNGQVLPMSEYADYGIQSQSVTKYYLGYPKEILQRQYVETLV
ncbi:MAG: hypothetical protein AAFO07_19025, partial [Bacteroidota bacterium]